MTRQGKQPDLINKVVGRRLRLKRELMSLSQTELGKIIGVSRIKVGQFESGNSAVPASTLYKCAQFFKVDLRYFFDDTENDNDTDGTNVAQFDPLLNRDTVSLIKDFNAVNDHEVRKKAAAVIERAAALLARKI